MPFPQARSRKAVFIVLALVVALAVTFRVFLHRNDFLYAGTIEATKVDLSARIPSVITAVKVREGDAVVERQEVVALACEDIRVAAELASENYRRTVKLFREGTTSQETMDVVKNRKEDADVRLGWCSVRSPIRGTVLNRFHEPGEWVSPGTKLLTLADIHDVWAYIYVPQPEVSRLKTGMKLSGYLPELKRSFPGTIVKINDEAEFTPKNVQTRSERTRLVYGVKISFLGANEDEALKPGMTIEVRLPRE